MLNLPVGTHEFKFIVDGEIRCSNDFPTVMDANGNLTNYIEVSSVSKIFPLFPCSSFDQPFNPFPFFSTQGVPEDHFDQSGEQKNGMEEDDEFSQEIPAGINDKEPPRLPPHLNKVILNSENSSNDPTLLPVPHHVMLNHLYALSIRDRVMVLATTSRYQQKYVTTVFYKPVST